ncbi:hypothetical protein BI292_13625 [Pseudomonas sp. 43NM1]|uniref:hypothetical protein n=1 Tax=Pseudomonas sp. 43NM1 TaxID=1904755 RepID=UPI000C3228BC|nr:hypothetical protein [Pseudomonas sp. 43NM1]PKH24199.1 hypothetical protein BI292_13625 [Pseudomonas sp. 43NM1]
MSNSLDRFTHGLTRAIERRAKQQTKQNVKTAEKVDSDGTKTSAKTATTTTLSNEQYQATIIQIMIARIKQIRNSNND